MQVTPSTFTVAEYCEQMKDSKIIVNREYQRSGKVWPPAARSFLLETILLGYPIPKLSLYQKTDLKTKTTLKEIVDGQQRSETILSFFKNEFKITKGDFAGKRFDQLDPEDQQKFIDYQLSVDVFVGATQAEIREVFRRMNSYTVPLNYQEKRHATYQGEFKWFMVDLSRKYSQTLKDIGTFSEGQLTRMNDSVLLSEITIAFTDGIVSASEKRIDKLYEKNDLEFPQASEYSNRIDKFFEKILNWPDIHKTGLMKPYNFLSLALAITHQLDPIEKLNSNYEVEAKQSFQNEIVLANLSSLSEALSSDSPEEKFKDFVAACSSSTNRLKQRETRFITFCRALEPNLI